MDNDPKSWLYHLYKKTPTCHQKYVQTFVISALPETIRHKKPVKMSVTNFGKKIKYSKVKVTKKKKKTRKEKNGNREAALAHTTIYVNVDKVGQTPHKGMKIGHLSEGAFLFSYYFFTTYIDSHK